MSDTPHGLTLTLVLAFFTWMLFIGYRTWRGRSHTEMRENFLIGNRNVSAWLVAIGLIMGWLDATQFGFTPALAFDMGYASFAYVLSAPLFLFILSCFAGHIRDHAHKHGSYMIGNYFGRELSPRCAVLVGATMAIFFTLWLSMNFAIGGKLLGTLLGVSTGTAVAGIGLVTLAYMLMGGFLAGVRTDLIQFLICLPFFALLAYVIAPKVGTQMPPLATISQTNPWDWFSLFMLNGASTLVAPDVWQRIYSAKTTQDAKRGIRIAAVLVIFMLVPFLLPGLIIKHMGLAADSSNLAPVLFSMLPAWLLPLVIVTFMAAVMSTISTTLFGASMVVSSDIALELRMVTKAKLHQLARACMLIILPLAAFVASLPIDIVTLGLTCLGATLNIFPLGAALLLGFKVSERAAFYSVLFSLIAYVIGAFHQIYTGPLATLPLAVATGTLLLFEGLSRKPARNR